MKKASLILFLTTVSIAAHAQLGTPLTQYSGNQMVYNPAYAGVYNLLAANLSMRKLWVGLPGSPSLFSVNAHAPIRNSRNALGLIIQREQWGASIGHYAYANYAHKFYLEDGVLNFGLQVGVFNLATDWNKIDYVEDWDDPALGKGRVSSTHFDANFGIYYQASDFYLGFSAKHLTQSKYEFLTLPTNDELWFSQKRMEFFFIGGLNLILSDNWVLRPEYLIRYVHTTPTTFNVGAHLGYRRKHFVGLNLQTGQKAVSITGRTMVTPELWIGYSYDMYYGIVRPYQKGSHELSISYYIDSFWNKSKPKQKYLV